MSKKYATATHHVLTHGCCRVQLADAAILGNDDRRLFAKHETESVTKCPSVRKTGQTRRFLSLQSAVAAAVVVVVIAVVSQNVVHDPQSDEPPRGRIAQPFQSELSRFSLLAGSSQVERFFCEISGQTVAAGSQKNGFLEIAGSFQGDDEVVDVGIEQRPTGGRKMSGKKLQSLHQTELAHFDHREEKSQSVVGRPAATTTTTTRTAIQGHDVVLSAVQTNGALAKVDLVTGNVERPGDAGTNGKMTKTAAAVHLKAEKSARQID